MIKATAYRQDTGPDIESLARAMGYEWNGSKFVKDEEAPAPTYRRRVSHMPNDFSERVKKGWVKRRLNKHTSGNRNVSQATLTNGRVRKAFTKFRPGTYEAISALTVNGVFNLTEVAHEAGATFRQCKNRIQLFAWKYNAANSDNKRYMIERTNGSIFVRRLA